MKKLLFLVFTIHCSLLTIIRRNSFYLIVLMLSLCSGHCFSQWQQTIGPTKFNNAIISFIDISGTNIFAAKWGGGLFLSTDNGASWSAINNGLDSSIFISSFIVNGNNIYAGTYNNKGIFKSTDNGVSWNVINNTLPSMVTSFAVSGENLFAGTLERGVFLSTDGGISWDAVNNGLTDTLVKSLAISGTKIFAGTNKGVFLSSDNGNSWNSIGTGLPINIGIKTLAISGSNIFVGTWGHGIFLSTDNGASWNEANNGTTSDQIWTFMIIGKNILTATEGGGVFLTIDNGESWTAVNNGFLENRPSIWSLAIYNNDIYAGTESYGVWKRPLSEVITGMNVTESQKSDIGIKINPNPVEQKTKISYQLPVKSNINISVYDITGRKVATLVNEEKEKGDYSISYNTSNLSSGLYFVKLQNNQSVILTKFIKQ